MPSHVLITGGAGFIGSHVADRLLAQGYRVRVLDALLPQVHGPDAVRPSYLHPDVELQIGDVRDGTAVRKALAGVDAVFHFAARVGVGQSMYRVADYTEHNTLGTAVLMEALMEHPLERLVVASSMSIYGEGRYRCADGSITDRVVRSDAQLRAGRWDPVGPAGETLVPVPTPEDKLPALSSIYALSKFDQEIMAMVLGRAYGIPTTALRFFNVYGEHQALSNPYTGVLAIFASRLLNDRPPLVFEDGEQRRDFISVHDVAEACLLALEHTAAIGQVFNIGSGESITVRAIAERMAAALGRDIAPEISGRFRSGDIRHCFADTGKARELLGFTASVQLEDGVMQLAEWLATQCAEDRVSEAAEELRQRGLSA
ncbi:MAG: NAD-dependent epimerase/dehydratase family protein [Thiohalomonadaceae bacterium]